ncbi:MAG: 1-deoxy-D-xylulose-5-phosphate reductoisomerase [Fibrobacteres bacterium]|nr:1-deoxy-D-xylulose-5-phosphate reductoisomerase [Fibrobacterota bacterium]
MKKITILGSTGSIGVNSLAVVKEHSSKLKVSGLSARSNLKVFQKQLDEFKPAHASLSNESDWTKLKYSPKMVRMSGEEGLTALASGRYDIIINAIVGAAGIIPTVKASETGKRIALANKESLVAAGELINRNLKKHGGEIIPVDSEHSAIFQCLRGSKPEEIEKIIITASGGPFRGTPASLLKKVSVKEALRHPTWSMGSKITIDSATLMNKGLEVIEAHFLFNIPFEKIDVVVHPQSIIHSMVQFVDGSVIAHLGHPDMKVPIQYALTHPAKWPLPGRRINFAELGRLDFEKPDTGRFPSLALAYAAGKTGGTMPAVMNAANEIAVEAFLHGKIGFMEIPKLIEKAMKRHAICKTYTLETLIATDKETRRAVSEWVS